MSDCDKVTLTPEKRRLHMIDKHGYPRNYDFKLVERGIDKRSSVLRGGNAPPNGRRRRVSEVGEAGWQTAARERTAGGKNRGEQRKSANREPNERSSKAKSDLAGSKQPSASGATDGAKGSVDLPGMATPAGGSKPSQNIKTIDDEVEALNKNLSSLQFVPTSVRLKEKKRAS